jgi:hypothetical protein
MSAEGTIYGCIFGGGLPTLKHPFVYQYNKDVIERLPETVGEKIVVRSMFTVPMRNEVPIGSFYRNQMIHFGASYNHLIIKWNQWVDEFEDLLRRLYWYEAYLHVDAEDVGIISYKWQADLDALHENPPRPVEKWTRTNI